VIALSTAWHPQQDGDLPAALKAIQAMGYEAVEIGVSESHFRLKKVQKAVEKLKLKVVSIHNVCREGKTPAENVRGDWLGSPDPEQRRAGVEATRETIQNAEALGASAVVLHLGSPPIEQRWEKRELLCRLVAGGAQAEEEMGVTREDILAERDAQAPACFAAACQSLAELLEADSPVRLGIEVRVGYHEVPSFEEVATLLERFPPPRVGYWHDTGHAAIQEAMGMVPQLEWLKRFGSRTLGAHLHDVVRRERLIDHFPPGLGFVDFAAVRSLLPAEALPVEEVSAQFFAEEVAMGREHLRRLGF
jgi:sugar phosphate isomerase/epimerase